MIEGRQGVGAALFAVALLLTFRDLYTGGAQKAQAEGAFILLQSRHFFLLADIVNAPEPKLKSRFMIPTLKVLYWYVKL